MHNIFGDKKALGFPREQEKVALKMIALGGIHC